MSGSSVSKRKEIVTEIIPMASAKWENDEFLGSPIDFGIPGERLASAGWYRLLPAG